MQECWSNQDCLGIGPAGANLICHAIQDDCSSDGIGSLCDMSCADSPDICGDKGALVCGDEGACEPRSCLDGQECHAVQLCDPAAGSAGPHGCSFVTCQAGTNTMKFHSDIDQGLSDESWCVNIPNVSTICLVLFFVTL